MCNPQDLNVLWFPSGDDRVQIVTEAEATGGDLSAMRSAQRQLGVELGKPFQIAGGPAAVRPGPGAQAVAA
eukprot:6214983-Heterocapsa_arctica.AAC.1